jgi:hypothetical protein
MMGADALMRRYDTDPATPVGRLVQDLGGLAGGGYGELPAGHFPAFVRHDLPELGYERSRPEPEWARARRVEGRHHEVDLPTFQLGGWYDIFAQGALDNFSAMRRAVRSGPVRSATLVMGPWSHANQQHVIGDVNFGFGANSVLHGHARTPARPRPSARLVRARPPTTPRPWAGCGVVPHRTEPAQHGVSALPVMEGLQVLEQGGGQLQPGAPWSAVEEFDVRDRRRQLGAGSGLP